MHRTSPFLHIQHLLSLCLFQDSHSNRSELISYCSFDLHLPAISDVEYLFKITAPVVPVGHLYVFTSFPHILIRLFVIELYELCILNITLIREMTCKYFLPFGKLPFHFVDGFLCCAGAFLFDVVPLDYFFCFWC